MTYHVRHSGKRLEVAALDLSGTLDAVLERVGHVAGRVKALREEALSVHSDAPGSAGVSPALVRPEPARRTVTPSSHLLARRG